MSDATGDEASQHRDKPPGTKRLRVILSFVCYLLLGVPVWWHTTDIHRAQLSHEAIADTLQQVQAASLLLPVHLHLYVVLPAGRDDPGADAQAWLQHLKQHLEQGGWREHLQQGRLQLQVKVESGPKGSCTAACSTITGTCSHTNTTTTGSSSSSSSSGGEGSPGCLLAWQALRQQAVDSSEQGLDQTLLDLLGNEEQAGRYTLFVLPQQLASARGSNHTSSSGAQSAITIGAHRHAWVWAVSTGEHAANTMAPSTAAAAAQAAQQLLQDNWATHLVSQSQLGGGISSSSSGSSVGDLPISPAGELLLSFSLLNAGPTAAVFDWQFDRFERQYLVPLQQALAPVAGVSVESQVVFYTRAKVNGSWSSSHKAWVVHSADLPFFMDSDWPVEAAGIDIAAAGMGTSNHPSSGMAGRAAATGSDTTSSTAAEAAAQRARPSDAASVPAHVLHFLVYIPPPEQQPLLLLDAAGQPSAGNSMWLPSWGGLLVVHPPVKPRRVAGEQLTGHLDGGEEAPPGVKGNAGGLHSSGSNSSSGSSRARHSTLPEGAWPPTPQQLTHSQQQQIARVVAGQLQALFGLAPAAAANHAPTRVHGSGDNMAVQQLAPVSSGLSGWAVDRLVMSAVASQVAGAAKVLGSLSKLLEELPNLETPDVIGDQVTASLASIQSALQAIRSGDYAAASAAARAARAAAESAFLHPAVLAQLNFPESHKLGVYMPLFLPLCVPVLKGLLLEVKRYMKSVVVELRAPTVS